MALFTGGEWESYPHPQMPKPASADGPWGEAITYWLNARGWRQADLLKAVHDVGGTTNKNTISSATRGYNCSTRVLRVIASALKVPLEDVLVSPDRKSASEERRQLITEAVDRAMREYDARNAPKPPHPPTPPEQVEPPPPQSYAQKRDTFMEEMVREDARRKTQVKQRSAVAQRKIVKNRRKR